MDKRSKVMKIKENNSELFTHVGNLLPSPLTKGIIKAIVLQDADIRDRLVQIEGYDSTSLDLSYYQHSFLKRVSSLVTYLIDELGIQLQPNSDYYVISDDALTELVKTILVRYKKKWLSLLDTYNIQFNPIKPYDMTTHDEIISDHLESSNVDNNSGTSVDNNNSSDNVSNTASSNSESSETNDDNHYGFNSFQKSAVNNTENSATFVENSNNSKEEQHSSVSNNTFNRTKESSYERDNTKEREIIRSGNIGNKTPQELIEEQRRFLNWVFYDNMFSDIDRVIAFPKW